MNTKTRPTRACFGVQRVPLFFPSSRTPKTHPFGACFWCPTHLLPLLFLSNTKTRPTRACFGVRRVPTPSPRTEHHKHAHKGVFVVSDMFPPPNTLPRLPPLCGTPETPCFWCSACSRPSLPPRIPETCPWGHVFGVRHLFNLPLPSNINERTLAGTFFGVWSYQRLP